MSGEEVEESVVFIQFNPRSEEASLLTVAERRATQREMEQADSRECIPPTNSNTGTTATYGRKCRSSKSQGSVLRNGVFTAGR